MYTKSRARSLLKNSKYSYDPFRNKKGGATEHETNTNDDYGFGSPPSTNRRM